jgi:ubiquinone biosynthesis UbiH/UbiF/VisC/COQ6 family hydroxylase
LIQRKACRFGPVESGAMTMPHSYDVIIVGAGPAGLAFARALAGTRLRIAIIDQSPAATLAAPPCDGREIALTHRSIATLQRLGAWQRLDPAHIAPLREARVLNGERSFALSFAGPHEGDRLGSLVSNHHIRRALFQSTVDQTGLTLLAGTNIRGVRTDADAATVLLDDGRSLSARLVVGADSRFSFVRRQLEIGAQVNPLGRSMLVARVAHAAAHRGIATEWFGHGQTIAMLPLNAPRVSSAVLTLPSAAIDRLAALDGVALGAELTRRFRARLGAMAVLEGPHVYPLTTTYAHRFVARRAALVGDAAVGMHPVTAHGFNLGLQGAVKLADLIAEAAQHKRDIAGDILLRRYEAAHRLASAPLYASTNLLVRLYTDDRPVARIVRPLALRAAARLPMVRTAIARRLMQQ